MELHFCTHGGNIHGSLLAIAFHKMLTSIYLIYYWLIQIFIKAFLKIKKNAKQVCLFVSCWIVRAEVDKSIFSIIHILLDHLRYFTKELKFNTYDCKTLCQHSVHILCNMSRNNCRLCCCNLDYTLLVHIRLYLQIVQHSVV